MKQLITPIAPNASPIPGLSHQTLAGSQDGLKALSVWVQEIQPRGATPPHRHDCEEVVLITKGSGVVEMEGKRYAFQAPCSLNIPQNAFHQIINTGDTPLETYGIFSMTPVEVFLPNEEKLALPWPS